MTNQQNAGPAGPRVVVEVGNEYHEPGRTRIEVHSDGRALASNRLEGKEDRGETNVDVAKIDQVVREAGPQLQRFQERRMRPGIPDEPRYHIEIEGEGRRYAVDLWRSELEEIPTLHRLVRDLEEAAQRAVSDRLAL